MGARARSCGVHRGPEFFFDFTGHNFIEFFVFVIRNSFYQLQSKVGWPHLKLFRTSFHFREKWPKNFCFKWNSNKIRHVITTYFSQTQANEQKLTTNLKNVALANNLQEIYSHNQGPNIWAMIMTTMPYQRKVEHVFFALKNNLIT